MFSRQRYWGEPIPIVNCPKCGYVAISESELPLRLPEVESYQPTAMGESPLAKMDEWVNVPCPTCGEQAKRETDTMPQWAGSSWYFLRYCDAHFEDALASKEAINYWMPVDWYNGGMEHTTLHLLYSRFWYKFLYDIGVVPTKEPYAKRTSHGMILGENNEKMSKSRGNVVNPDDIVSEYGADVLRLYEMFIGDFEKAAPWSQTSIKGCKRFLDRVWTLSQKVGNGSGYSQKLESSIHKAIKKVGDDIETMKFNTAIATLMSLLHEYNDAKELTKDDLSVFLTLLSPFAPHIAEEMNESLELSMLAKREWPKFDESKLADDTVEIAVSINGKVKSRIMISVDISAEDAINAAKSDEKIMDTISGKTIVKEIYVPGKLVNIVIK